MRVMVCSTSWSCSWLWLCSCDIMDNLLYPYPVLLSIQICLQNHCCCHLVNYLSTLIAPYVSFQQNSLSGNSRKPFVPIFNWEVEFTFQLLDKSANFICF